VDFFTNQINFLQEYFRISRKIDAEWGKKTRQDDGRAVFRDALKYY